MIYPMLRICDNCGFGSLRAPLTAPGCKTGAYGNIDKRTHAGVAASTGRPWSSQVSGRLGSDRTAWPWAMQVLTETGDGLIRPEPRGIRGMIFRSRHTSAAFGQVRTAPGTSPIAILSCP
jgi:hypothetical protein